MKPLVMERALGTLQALTAPQLAAQHAVSVCAHVPACPEPLEPLSASLVGLAWQRCWRLLLLWPPWQWHHQLMASCA